MAGMKDLGKEQFIPFLDVTKDLTLSSCSWKRVDLSTIFELTVNEEVESVEYICYPAPVDEVMYNKPELPQEIRIKEGNAIYDFMFDQIYNLPVGEECKVPALLCFGGTGKKAWRGIATLTDKSLNTVDRKISFKINFGGEIDKGTYSISEGTPTFSPGLPA